MSRGKKILIISILIIIGIRLFLPVIILNLVNNKLKNIPEYYGHVDDIDLSFLTGSYKIEGISLIKENGDSSLPFFFAEAIHFSVNWSMLVKGEIEGEIIVVEPKVTFINAPTKEATQKEISKDWISTIKSMMPIEINKFEILNGSIRYKDIRQKPEINLSMQNLNATAINLKNKKSLKLLPATIDASSDVLENGNFNLHIDIAPLNKTPTFDLNAKLENIQLIDLNDFLKAYGNFDVKKGTFSVYTEVAARDGAFTGYIKPFIKDIDVAQAKKEENAIQKIWKNIVETSSEILENKSKEQIASKVPFSGKFTDPDVDILTIIFTLLKNAFIQALVPSIENSININKVETKNNKEKQ